MKLAANFVSTLAVTFAVLAFTTSASAQNRQIKSDILSMTMEINQAVRSDELSDDQLLNMRDGLEELLGSLSGPRKGSLICSKQGNGLFYPTSASTGQIVGSTSSNAGYSNFDDCKANLPARGVVVACFKQGNGLFYPSKSTDGQIVGSTSSNAGHSTASTCRQTLPKRGDELACYKQGNGLFYPSKPETGEIVGSTSSNAGYSDLNSCLKVITQ